MRRILYTGVCGLLLAIGAARAEVIVQVAPPAPLVGAQKLVHTLGGPYGIVPTTEHIVGD